MRPYRIDLLLFAEEKREAPTPRRRERARREGHVFKSVELTSALVLLAVYGLIRVWAPAAGRDLAAWTQRFLEQAPRDWGVGDVQGMMADAALAWARVAAPFLAAGLALTLLVNCSRAASLGPPPGSTPASPS